MSLPTTPEVVDSRKETVLPPKGLEYAIARRELRLPFPS
jgi:hypothetical protein